MTCISKFPFSNSQCHEKLGVSFAHQCHEKMGVSEDAQDNMQKNIQTQAAGSFKQTLMQGTFADCFKNVLPPPSNNDVGSRNLTSSPIPSARMDTQNKSTPVTKRKLRATTTINFESRFEVQQEGSHVEMEPQTDDDNSTLQIVKDKVILRLKCHEISISQLKRGDTESMYEHNFAYLTKNFEAELDIFASQMTSIPFWSTEVLKDMLLKVPARFSCRLCVAHLKKSYHTGVNFWLDVHIITNLWHDVAVPASICSMEDVQASNKYLDTEKIDLILLATNFLPLQKKRKTDIDTQTATDTADTAKEIATETDAKTTTNTTTKTTTKTAMKTETETEEATETEINSEIVHNDYKTPPISRLSSTASSPLKLHWTSSVTMGAQYTDNITLDMYSHAQYHDIFGRGGSRQGSPYILSQE